MKKIISLLVFLAVLTTVLFAADPIAYLIQGKGKLQILRDSKAIKFKNGDMLYNNDEIKTAGESFAAIKYVDGGATIKVFPNSVIKLTAMKQDKQLSKNSIIQKGGLYSKVNSRIKGGYQVETPTTVASVKGTGFLTRLNDDKSTVIVVMEGEVEVAHKESGNKMKAGAGTTAVSSASGSVDVAPTKAEDLSKTEMSEIEKTNLDALKTLKIQVNDEQGNIKYIEITY